MYHYPASLTWKHLDTTSPLDQVVSNADFGNTPNGGTLNTTKENELYFAVGVDDNGNNSAPSAGSGYTLEDHQDDSTNHERFYSEDRISAHGSHQTNFSIAAGSDWAVIGASFKPAGTPTYASPAPGSGVVDQEEIGAIGSIHLLGWLFRTMVSW